MTAYVTRSPDWLDAVSYLKPGALVPCDPKGNPIQFRVFGEPILDRFVPTRYASVLDTALRIRSGHLKRRDPQPFKFTEAEVKELGLIHYRGATLVGMLIPFEPCGCCGSDWHPETRNHNRCSKCGGLR